MLHPLLQPGDSLGTGWPTWSQCPSHDSDWSDPVSHLSSNGPIKLSFSSPASFEGDKPGLSLLLCVLRRWQILLISLIWGQLEKQILLDFVNKGFSWTRAGVGSAGVNTHFQFLSLLCFFFHRDVSRLTPFTWFHPPARTAAPNLLFRRVKVCCNYSGHFKMEKLLEKLKFYPGHNSNLNQAGAWLEEDLPKK